MVLVVREVKISKNKEIKSMRTKKTLNGPNGDLQKTERFKARTSCYLDGRVRHHTLLVGPTRTN